MTKEEALEVRERLMEDLLELKNPYTNEPVIDKVMENEDVYNGPRAPRGPDILFLTKNLETDTGGLTVFKTLDSIIPSFAITGTHRMNGIFAASGPSYRQKSKISNLTIADPAPIMLHTLGLKIPSYMDGVPRRELFTEDFWASHKPEFSDVSLPGRGKGKEGEDHDEEILERLKGLGYLS